MLQSINAQESDTVDGTALMKAVVFYMAAAVEAFTFCFCGEYLTAKVGTIEIFPLVSLYRGVNLCDSAIHRTMILNNHNYVFFMEDINI